MTGPRKRRRYEDRPTWVNVLIGVGIGVGMTWGLDALGVWDWLS